MCPEIRIQEDESKSEFVYLGLNIFKASYKSLGIEVYQWVLAIISILLQAAALPYLVNRTIVSLSKLHVWVKIISDRPNFTVRVNCWLNFIFCEFCTKSGIKQWCSVGHSYRIEFRTQWTQWRRKVVSGKESKYQNPDWPTSDHTNLLLAASQDWNLTLISFAYELSSFSPALAEKNTVCDVTE